MGQPVSTCSAYSEVHSTIPPLGPRSDLWVVVVTTSACGTGSKSPVEYLSRDQTGEVRHVDHERGADVGGDLSQAGEVDPPGIGRVTGHEDQRAQFPGLLGDAS